MPILNYYLVEGQHTPAQLKQLLEESSSLYGEVLESPMHRVRAFVTLYPPPLIAVGGELVSENSRSAPYFTFVVMQGRPLEKRHRLLAGFSDLLVNILGADRSEIRGHAIEVHPQDWGIGGVPASILRAEELRLREEKTGIKV